ncbi:protein kinase [Streptantibioticus parmotrematis]|uniref:serine/threonine-protein kinase n=1 Tax=Streptantibioticus parmotrematis TaxID=2873249 RepID=UPI0033F8BC72
MSDDAPRDEAAEDDGTRLLAGRYALGECLGSGGMGTVWRAEDRTLEREVAVKEITVGTLAGEQLAVLHVRLRQEARAAARISHPGVVTVHDVLEEDGRPWIVMELVDGRSLEEVVATEGTLLPRDAARVGADLVATLRSAHRAGVLHRDVKPANVLLERGGRTVLTDFGIAVVDGLQGGLTRSGDIVGSPDYLAPERATGHRPGPASDLWSLGATLYAAVEGRSPFRRTSTMGTLHALVSEPLPPARDAGALAPVLEALLRKDPDQRPTAERAQRMLEDVANGRPPRGVTPVHPPTEVVTPQPPSAGHGFAHQPTQVAPARPPSTVPIAYPGAHEPPRRGRTGLLVGATAVAAALLGGGVAAAVLVDASHHHAVRAEARPGTGGAVVPSTPAPAVPSSLPSAPVQPPAATAPTQAAAAPDEVVQAYYTAINSGDYQDAWELGGDNIEDGSYDSFVSGFAETASDTVDVESVDGDQVTVQLDAEQTDGGHEYFAGTYTVRGGVITGADITPLSDG